MAALQLWFEPMTCTFVMGSGVTPRSTTDSTGNPLARILDGCMLCMTGLDSTHTFLVSRRHRLRLSDHRFSASEHHIAFFCCCCFKFYYVCYLSCWLEFHEKEKKKTSKTLNGDWLGIPNNFLNNPKHTSATLNDLFVPRDLLSIED